MKGITLKEKLTLNVKLKKVYYCTYCKKYSLRKDVMIRHENGCTMNPNRHCKLCETAGELNDIPELIAKYKKIYFQKNHPRTSEEEGTILKDIKEDTGNCPNCVLTIIRLSHLQLSNFDYKEELKKFWESTRD